MKRVFLILMALSITGCEKYIAFDFLLPEEYECVYCFIPEKTKNWVNDTTIFFTKEELRLLPLLDWEGGKKRGQISLGSGTIDSLFDNWGSDRVSFFIFDKDVVDAIPWDDIVKNYCVLQRYDFTREDLNQIKCQIFYPPTKEMAQIHMYPPYNTFMSHD